VFVLNRSLRQIVMGFCAIENGILVKNFPTLCFAALLEGKKVALGLSIDAQHRRREE
jgi:hypothetical protein